MPKIRDLGINVIPVTMRPPEIGLGGGYVLANDPPTCDTNESCDPSGQCEPSCEESGAPRGAGGLGPEAIAQLRHQLRNRIGR